MKKKIQAFGKTGMHIYIAKRDGYQLGQEVELSDPAGMKPLTREEVQRMIDSSIEKAKGY